MGFMVDYVRKIKDGIIIGHKITRLKNVCDEFGIRDDSLLYIFKHCIGLYIDKL